MEMPIEMRRWWSGGVASSYKYHLFSAAAIHLQSQTFHAPNFKMQQLLILFFLSSTTTILAADAAAPKNVFILSGQSNMFGRGGVNTTKLADRTLLRTWDGVVPAECRPNPLILRLGEEMEWEEACEPLHKLVVNSEGIGPSMPFANALLKRDPAIGSIGLVPCAVSASNISSGSRNSPNYTRMLGQARAAIAEGAMLRALLWYQGESDSQYESDAEAYRGRLVKLLNDIRGDLQSPSLHIIHVALATGFNSTLVETIRQVQLHTNIPNVKSVDAAGLPTNFGDFLHLSTPSQVRLGSILADAFLHV